jgi:hypothetical protein
MNESHRKYALRLLESLGVVVSERIVSASVHMKADGPIRVRITCLPGELSVPPVAEFPADEPVEIIKVVR